MTELPYAKSLSVAKVQATRYAGSTKMSVRVRDALYTSPHPDSHTTARAPTTMPTPRRRPDRPPSRFPNAPPAKKPTSYNPALRGLLRDKPTDLAAFLSQAKADADGNLFKETKIKSRRSTWAVSGTTTLTRPLDYEPTPGNCGVQTLSFYARKVINDRTQDFDRKVLHHIPWKFGRIIWEDAVKT